MTFPWPWQRCNIYRLQSRGDNTFGTVCLSICPSIRLFVLSCLNFLTYDVDFWHRGWPWPWLGWNWKSRSWVKCQSVINDILLSFNLFWGQGLRSRSKLQVRPKAKLKVQDQRQSSRCHFSSGAEWSIVVLGLPSAAKSPMKHKSSTLLKTS